MGINLIKAIERSEGGLSPGSEEARSQRGSRTTCRGPATAGMPPGLTPLYDTGPVL